MLIKDGKSPPRRLPSARGLFMIDIVNGSVRIRSWPRKRGKPKTPEIAERETKFGVAQRVWNALTPNQQQALYQVTQGSPLLPRDVLTAAFYGRLATIELPNGRTLYEMPFYTDTSAALDTISQTPGETIIRGVNGWEATTPATGSAWTLIQDTTWSGDASERLTDVFDAPNEILLILTDSQAASSGRREIQVSDDGGSTFKNTAGDYWEFVDSANVALPTRLILNGASTTASMGSVALLRQPNGDLPALLETLTRPRPIICPTLSGPIDRLRLFNSSGNLRNGRLQVYGR